jgi:hypothetical protein
LVVVATLVVMLMVVVDGCGCGHGHGGAAGKHPNADIEGLRWKEEMLCNMWLCYNIQWLTKLKGPNLW